MTRNEDLAFAQQVDDWIQSRIGGDEVSFAELVRALPGVDPIVVRQRLSALDPVVATRVRWEEFNTVEQRCDDNLPVPHPLDFDWRFASSTIATTTNALLVRGGRLALIGAPSLWVALRDHWPPDKLHLLDANRILRSHAARVHERQLLTVDVLREKVPTFDVDTVVADPPWYPESLAGFLWTAAVALRLNGKLWLSVPPRGARPGIGRERDEFLRTASDLGFTLHEIRDGALRYSMPPFERAALAAEGLLAFVPGDWRQGDLCIFEKTSFCIENTPRPDPGAREDWIERTVEGVRIKVNTNAPDETTDPRLVSLLKGDVLGSVSRRDPRRAGVRVWTSGNRVFGCAAPHRLLEVLDAVSSSAHLVGVDVDAAAQIRLLVDRERAEYLRDDGATSLVQPPAT